MEKKEKDRIRTALQDYTAALVFCNDGSVVATRYGADGPYSGALEREIEALPAKITKYHPHEITKGQCRLDITFRPIQCDCTAVGPEERIELSMARATLEGRPAAVIGITTDAPKVVTLWGFPRLYTNCLWQKVRQVIRHEGGQFFISR